MIDALPRPGRLGVTFLESADGKGLGKVVCFAAGAPGTARRPKMRLAQLSFSMIGWMIPIAWSEAGWIMM